MPCRFIKGTWLTSPYKEDRAPANDAVGTARTEGVGHHRTPDVTQSDTKFAGLCLKCHPKANITDGTDTVNGSWKTIDRIHESVNGWKLTNVNHKYSCSKCHAPHSSRLPRLMVTDCMDKKHKGRMANNTSPALYASGYGYELNESAECFGYAGDFGGYCSDYPDEYYQGWGRGNYPGVYEEHPGATPNTSPGRIVACHASENGAWNNQKWNNKTQW